MVVGKSKLDNQNNIFVSSGLNPINTFVEIVSRFFIIMGVDSYYDCRLMKSNFL